MGAGAQCRGEQCAGRSRARNVALWSGVRNRAIDGGQSKSESVSNLSRKTAGTGQ